MQSRTTLFLGLAVLIACGGGGGGGSPTSAGPPPAATQAPPPPTPPPTPPPLNVSGGWRSLARSWDFRLEQNGTTLTGVVTGFKNVTYSNLNDPVLQISGTISQAGAVAFKAPVFAIDFTGNVESATRITGTLYDCVQICRNYGEILEKQ